jgi:DNA-binding IclR family transcriptional regulator
MASPEPYPGTQAVLRAVTVLKAFTDLQPEIGLSELARTVGLNKTTVYRMLTALESEGFVIKNPATESYRLGPEAIALGGRAMRSNDLRAASRSELEALAQATTETASLEVLFERDMLVLDEVVGGHVLGAAQHLGARWPAHATSTGKAVLAFLPDADSNAFLRGALPKITTNTLTTQAAMRRELIQIRQQGYAVATEELEDGFTAVGAPLFNHDGKAVAAISVGGPSARLTTARVSQIADRVVESAKVISQRLGYRET